MIFVHLSNVTAFSLPPTKEEVNAFSRVRLSVVSKITQKRVHGFG